MKPKRRYLVLWCCLMVLISQCQPISSTSYHEKDPKEAVPSASSWPNASFQIICTLSQLADLVQEMVPKDATIHVHSICQSGVDPHTYVATISDVKRIQGADVIYGIGLHLEAQMLHFLKKMNHAVLVGEHAIPKDQLIPWQGKTSMQAYDPHIWTDISLWMQVAQYVKHNLIRRLPHEKHHIETQAERYMNELAQTHERLKTMIQSIPEDKRILLTSHDAFAYFSRAYQIRTKALLGITTEAEASLKEVIALGEWVIQHQVAVAFGESSVPNKFLEAVIQATSSRGHLLRLCEDALYSDSMGPPNTPEGTYLGMMLYNGRIISTELKK